MAALVHLMVGARSAGPAALITPVARTAVIALLAGLVAAPALAQSAVPRLPVSNPLVNSAIGANQGGRNVSNDDDELDGGGAAGLQGYPGRGFVINGRLVSRYDNNLSRQAIKDDGMRVRPSVDASVGLGSGRIGIYGVGMLGRDFVFGNQRLQGRDRHSYGGGVTARLSRCTLDAGASYRRTLSFQSELVAFGVLEQGTGLVGANIQCRITSALVASTSVTKGDTSIVRGETSAFDSNRMVYAGGLQLSRPALGTVSIDGSITDVVLTGRQVLTPDGLVDDGLKQRSLRLGFARPIGDRINIALGASFLDTQPTATTNLIIVDGIVQVVDRDGFRGGGYDARIDLRPTPRLSLGFGANRGIRSNNFAGARMILADTIEADVSYQLGRSLSVSASYQQRRTSFLGTVVTAVEPLRRDGDLFRRYGARMKANLGRVLELALEVNHNSRTSNPATFNFDSTGVGLVLGFKLGKQGVR